MKISKEIIPAFSLKILGGVMAFFSAVLTAKVLSQEEYGLFVLYMSSFFLMVYFVVFGQDQVLVKKFGEFGTIFISKKASLIFFVNSLGLSVICFFLFFLSKFSFLISSLLATLIFLAFHLTATRRISCSALRCGGRPVLAILPESFLQPFLFFCALVFIYYNYTHSSIEVILIFYFSSFSLAGLFSGFLRKEYLVLDQSPVSDDRVLVLLRSGFFFCLLAIIDGLSMQIDRFVIGYELGYKQVSIYFVAIRIVEFLFFFESALLLVTMPRLSRSFFSNDYDQFGKILVGQARMVFLYVLLSTVFAILFADEIVSLFGEKYSPAADVVCVLLIFYLVASLFGASQSNMTVLGLESLALKFTVFFILIGSIVMLVMAQLHGVWGVVMAKGSIEIAKRLFFSVCIYRKAKVFPFIFLLKKSV